MSGTETKTAEQLAAEIKAAHEASVNAVKGIAEEALGKAKAGEELTNATKAAADEALVKMNGLTTRLGELEQLVARGARPGGAGDGEKSLGQRFVEGENFKRFSDSGFAKSSAGADLQVKATLTSATTNAAGSVGAAVAPTRLEGVQGLPQRRLTIRALLSPGQMDGSTLEYVAETGFTNSAGMVAEGAKKPESDIKLALRSTSAKVIAHWMKASKQILSDAPQLSSVIDQRLLYGLSLKEEQQILYGDGTGQNLLGIVPQASAYAAAITIADATPIDMMRLAMLQAALAEYPATGHVMNPIDWAAIELTKDDLGRYIIGNPQGQGTPSLWGLPVVATQAIEVDKFLTGAFAMGAQLFDRWEGRVETGYENDDFTKNLVTILAEERIALAVYRPEAFVYGDFGRVTSGG